MILTAEYPLPEGARLVFTREDGRDTPTPPLIERETAPVNDPAVGRVGSVTHVSTTRRAGRDYLLLTLDIDDGAAVEAATRNGGAF